MILAIMYLANTQPKDVRPAVPLTRALVLTTTSAGPSKGCEMSEEFKPGDVVRLKSGGPKMTVTEVGEEVYCEWFDDKKEPQGRGFSPTSLKPAGSDDIGSARIYRG